MTAPVWIRGIWDEYGIDPSGVHYFTVASRSRDARRS
jgi:hypothetical protein